MDGTDAGLAVVGTRMYRSTVGGPHLLAVSGQVNFIPLTDEQT